MDYEEPSEGEEPHWNPDRMASEDLDLSNPDAVEAWFNDPVTEALHGDLGRAFRHEPVEAQIPQLWKFVSDQAALLAELLGQPQQGAEPATTAAVDQLRAALEGSVRRAISRIDELNR